MKRLVHLAAKLYPRSWRIRDGEEFDALLQEDRGNSRILLDVLTGAFFMRVRRTWKGALIGVSVFAATPAAAQWAAKHPDFTSGAHRLFHMDSAPGAMLEFLVLLVLGISGMLTLMRVARAGRIFVGLASSYIAAIVLVSLLTPRTIVGIGDSYCWDLWCFGVHSVNGTPQGESVLYTAEMFLFADSNSDSVSLGRMRQNRSSTHWMRRAAGSPSPLLRRRRLPPRISSSNRANRSNFV